MSRMRKVWIAGGIGVLLAAIPLAVFGASAHAGTGTTGQRVGMVRYIASVEGVTPAVLRQDLKAGDTLLQIAGSKYATADDLATALLARFKARMQKAVTAGRITASQEATRYNKLHARVAQLVVTPHPKLGAVKGSWKAAVGVRGSILQTFVATCDTTPAALKTAIKAGGQTPLAICQSTNPTITQDTLVSALVSAVKTKLDAAAQTRPMIAQHESQILSRVQNRLNTWVTTTLTAHA